MYLVTNPDLVPSPASFKVSEEDFEDTVSKKGFQKHTYLGRHHWISLDDINRLNVKQWEKYIKQSYLLVAAKLSKKAQKELGLI
jgi:predicted DNA-binding protein (MmcQ/YjbR family)